MGISTSVEEGTCRSREEFPVPCVTYGAEPQGKPEKESELQKGYNQLYKDNDDLTKRNIFLLNNWMNWNVKMNS